MIGKNLEKIFSLDEKVIVLTGATGGYLAGGSPWNYDTQY